jgi:hypothetical protein
MMTEFAAQCCNETPEEGSEDHYEEMSINQIMNGDVPQPPSHGRGTRLMHVWI